MKTAAQHPVYRLYIDEVGSADLSSQSANNRYLSLSGLMFDLEYVAAEVSPRLEALKRTYFDSDPDSPICLHRKELVNKKPPFHNLEDPDVEAAFNKALLSLLTELDFQLITVVIDKHELKERYKRWVADPYHYCMRVLIERYVMTLASRDSFGDVMAEARGRKEDSRLKKSFERLWNEGTEYVESPMLHERLTSKELKLQPKSANVSGLQLADVIAHPSFAGCRCRHQNQSLPENFGGQITQILEDLKYVRSPGGRIDGWGRKWLP